MFNGQNSMRKKQLAPLRVVFRSDRKFVCGMCRQEYASRDEAKACIDDCVQEVAKISPIKVLRAASGSEYQCQICKRVYAQNEAAYNCARECATAEKNRLKREAQLAGVELALPTSRKKLKKSKLAPIQMKVMPKYNLKRKTGEEETVDTKPVMAAPPPVAEPQLAAVEAPAPPEAAKPEPAAPPAEAPKVQKDPNKKFTRAGAEYVCTVCSSRFFTKVEVNACWDKH